MVVPVARAAHEREALRAIARRFGAGTLIALAVLLATGLALAFHLNLWSNSSFQLKLGLIVVLGCALAWHVRRPDVHVLEAVVFVLSLVIVWLGLYLANGYY